MLNKLKSILPEKGNWEKVFDERIIQFEKKCIEYPSRTMKALSPLLKEDHYSIKKFIKSTLNKQRKEIEALLPDMLDLIREEIENRIYDTLDLIKNEMQNTNNEDENNGYAHSYAIIKLLLEKPF